MNDDIDPATHRLEHDSFGDIAVPPQRLWGAQTQRSLEFLRIWGEPMRREMRWCSRLCNSTSVPRPHSGRMIGRHMVMRCSGSARC